MPKGVQFSSSATTLLPPRAKAPAPKSKSDGDDSFETALKKAKPDTKPTRATKSAPGNAVTAGKKPKQDAKPAQKDATDDASDENKTTDPGAETTEDTNVISEVAQQQVSANKHAPKTTDHSDESPNPSNATPQPIVVAVSVPQKGPAQDAAPKDDDTKSPAPATPVLLKASPQPAEEPEPGETDTLKPVKPKPSLLRQAVDKLARRLPSDQTDEHDQVSDDDNSDAATAWQSQNIQTPQTASKSTASSTASKHADALDAAPPPKSDAEQRLTAAKTKSNPADDAPPQALAQANQDVPDDVPIRHDPVDRTVDMPLAIDTPAPKLPVTTVASAPPAPPPPRPEQDFASANHDRIVSSVKTQLLPNGGTMQLRLDPPNLGPLQVSVHMVDGAMTASFETSSDQATRLLSHSLGQLKTALETQGVSVEKLHVEQAPKNQESSTGDSDQQKRDSQQQQDGSDRDQQRREMLNRMWKRLALGRDPLDTVA